MFNLKTFAWIGVGSLLGWQMLADPASSELPTPIASPKPIALNATLQNGEVVGFEQFRRVFASVGGGRRLLFMVPQGDFRVDISDPERVVLMNPDYTCSLSFRVLSPESISTTPLSSDFCRDWLKARPGQTIILDEFSLKAANYDGPAFDLVHTMDGVSQYLRVAFISSPVGILECTITSSSGKFPVAKSTFQTWLRGFRISDANGQLVITRITATES